MKANLQHIIQLKKKNHLKYWITYYKIHSNIKAGAGWINFKDLKFASHTTGLTPRTFSNHIKKLLKLGWISKGDHGYFFRSYHKLFGLNKVKIFGDTEPEILARAAALMWDRNIYQQIYKITEKNTDKRKVLLANKKHGRVGLSEYPVGVRWFMNQFGYKSPTSGSRIEKLMEKFGLVEIQRNERVLFHCRDIGGWGMLRSMNIGRGIFIKNAMVCERLLNGMRPILQDK